MTAFNNKAGGFQLTPVGRVQTPTLAILTEREEKIRAFKSRTYFEVFGDFGVKAGEYRGRWFREDFAKNGDEDARAERIWEAETAEEIKTRCLGKTGIATEERKPTTQAPPLLYDLTSLQRDANGRGFSAKRTLQIAQQLYEKFKVITYPANGLPLSPGRLHRDGEGDAREDKRPGAGRARAQGGSDG